MTESIIVWVGSTLTSEILPVEVARSVVCKTRSWPNPLLSGVSFLACQMICMKLFVKKSVCNIDGKNLSISRCLEAPLDRSEAMSRLRRLQIVSNK